MKVTARIARLELAETFVISRESTDVAEVVQVEIRHGHVSGFGEGAPIDRYQETAESALAYVEEHADTLGDDPFALDEIEHRLPPREWAARAAIDGALHDLQGKLVDLPVWKLLGLEREGPPTSWTIWLGDPADMARRAVKADPSRTRQEDLHPRVGRPAAAPRVDIASRRIEIAGHEPRREPEDAKSMAHVDHPLYSGSRSVKNACRMS